jgi:hypothetical protein
LQRWEVDALFKGGLIGIGWHRINADFGRRHFHNGSSFAETLGMSSVGLIKCALPDDGDLPIFTAKDLVGCKARQAAVMVAVVG